ncbi:MAG: VWA domain-containing protein, partial [Planctomycetota bacterium]
SKPPTQVISLKPLPKSSIKAAQLPTEVQYLSPNETSGHDLSLSLTIDAGVRIEELQSVNHRIATKQLAENHLEVKLAQGSVVPNEDFVLRYRVAGETVRSALMTHDSERHDGKFFTLVAYPPQESVEQPRSPLEMIFVLDCSGSMGGEPLRQAKEAVACALKNLRPDDSFQIIQFSSSSSRLGRTPLLATSENIKRGLQYLNSLQGGGGTQMIKGIRASLDFPHDESRYRYVTFMTDGYIGNEADILRAVHSHLGESRIFSFGVGQAPNRYLMNRMAILGRGAAAYLSLNDDAENIMQRFADRISHPALTDVTVDWGTADVSEVYPRQLSDLVVGRQLVITGRYEGELDGITIRGRCGGRQVELPVRIAGSATHSGIPQVWARCKIADLMTSSLRAENPELEEAVTDVAINHQLVSAYTAMVAVDSMARTQGEFGTTVAVPVPVPSGVQYETTVATGNGG